MTLSELCIRRPVMTTLITATIIAFGVFGFRLLPVSALPKVDFPTIAVTATLPGASADTMAALVSGVIGRQLSTVADISSMSSNSSQGTSTITIQFDLNRNIDAAALDVQTALTIAQRRLPVEMIIPPSFRKVNPADFPVLFVVLNSSTLPLSTVHEYGDITIGQTLSQIPGVAQVSVYGAQKFAIRVQADPELAQQRPCHRARHPEAAGRQYGGGGRLPSGQIPGAARPDPAIGRDQRPDGPLDIHSSGRGRRRGNAADCDRAGDPRHLPV